MTAAGVAVHDAFGDDAVDDALRFAQACRRGFLVARRDRLATFFIAVRTSVRSAMLWSRRTIA